MAEIRAMTKSYLKGKGLFGLHIPIHSPLRETEVGTTAETMEEPLLLVACSAFFHIQPRATCPAVALPTMSWALPYQLLINKMPCRLAYRPV